MPPTSCPLTPMDKPAAVCPGQREEAARPKPCAALGTLNLTVQVVARPRPQSRHGSALLGGVFTHPNRWLYGSFASGFQPGGRGGVQHLLEEPVLGRIALADGVGNVVGEESGIAQRPAPQPVVGPIAL